MKPTALFCLLFAIACGEKDDTQAPEGDTDADSDADTDADSDADSDADADADTDADADALPDLTQDLDQEACEDGPGDEGATTYWVGTYLWTDANNAAGNERWIWYATSEWEAVGGADCEVVWDVTATKGGVGEGPDCEFSLSVRAEIDEDATTCPEEAWSVYADPTWTTVYDVDQQGSGIATWYFSGSGGLMGSGYWNETGQNFASNSSCVWF
jgi:hypothetical protein